MNWFKKIDVKELLKIENWSIEILISVFITTMVLLLIPENTNK